jgi:glycosyltransferase involved in cell wall biosynthesis
MIYNKNLYISKLFEKNLNIKWNYLLNILLIIIIFILNKSIKKKPKISIFLPIYNKENYIAKSISSIQNQTLKDIEIVAINDYSSDNSLIKIKDLSKEDDRIKIINNDKNHGLLYSRAMGILNSIGEYFINLDPDDEFKDNYCLEYLYKQAKNSNVDIISFDVLNKKNNEIINCKKSGKIQQQKELFYSAFNKNNYIVDYLITNKLIKRKIFLKAYEDFKEEIYNGKWNYHEDLIWSILVNKHAKSKLCINKLVYIYNYNNESLMNKRFWTLELENALYFLEMNKKLFRKKEEEKYLIEAYLWVINNLKPEIKYLLKINDRNIRKKTINAFQYALKYFNCSINQRFDINNFLNLFNT